MIKPPLVMDLAKALKAVIGSSDTQHKIRPEVKRTKRVSYRLTRAAIVKMTTITATQFSKVIVMLLKGMEFLPPPPF